MSACSRERILAEPTSYRPFSHDAAANFIDASERAMPLKVCHRVHFVMALRILRCDAQHQVQMSDRLAEQLRMGPNLGGSLQRYIDFTLQQIDLSVIDEQVLQLDRRKALSEQR